MCFPTGVVFGFGRAADQVGQQCVWGFTLSMGGLLEAFRHLVIYPGL